MSQAGKDFSSQNLRGRNFKGQDLTGANFSYADIRSANFTGAILINTNFTGVKAGIQNKWKFCLILALFLISILSVILFKAENFGVNASWSIGEKKLEGYYFVTITNITFFLLFSYLMVFRNLEIAVSISILVITSSAFFSYALSMFSSGTTEFTGIIASSLASGSFISICTVLILSITAAAIRIITNPWFSRSFIASLALVFVKLTGYALLPFGFGTIFNIISDSIKYDFIKTSFFLFTLALAVYISEKVVSIDKKYELIYRITVVITNFFGTIFRQADLTSSNFTKASLGNVDLREAKINHTLWLQVEKIDYIYFGNDYLKHKEARHLVQTLKGINQDFSNLNFESINLRDGDLKSSSFIGTNLNYANLRYADLTRANLKQAQLDGADLTGATLTGAYIEDWGITGDTKLEGIRCEYVYMHVPTKEDPDPIRKPDNRNEVFKDGDFADFIRPLTDTLDLYHNQGVDPRAIAIAFKDLAESHPEASLRIVAMEVKGDGKFLLRAKTATTADKSELSAEYFSTYNQIKGLSEAQVRALLVEKDSRIQSLEGMVVTALQRPSFYSHIERTDSVSNTGGISQNVSGGNVYGGMQAAQGNNNEQVQEIHSIASSEQGLTQDQVIELFAQLESVLKQPELPGEVQAKAAKYLDAAKEEVQAKEPDKQLAAGNLKRMAETIESTSKTMESGKKIWETTKPILGALLPWLGVAKGFFGF